MPDPPPIFRCRCEVKSFINRIEGLGLVCPISRQQYFELLNLKQNKNQKFHNSEIRINQFTYCPFQSKDFPDFPEKFDTTGKIKRYGYDKVRWLWVTTNRLTYPDSAKRMSCWLTPTRHRRVNWSAQLSQKVKLRHIRRPSNLSKWSKGVSGWVPESARDRFPATYLKFDN